MFKMLRTQERSQIAIGLKKYIELSGHFIFFLYNPKKDSLLGPIDKSELLIQQQLYTADFILASSFPMGG